MQSGLLNNGTAPKIFSTNRSPLRRTLNILRTRFPTLCHTRTCAYQWLLKSQNGMKWTILFCSFPDSLSWSHTVSHPIPLKNFDLHVNLPTPKPKFYVKNQKIMPHSVPFWVLLTAYLKGFLDSFNKYLYFCGGTQMTNRRPLTVLVVCPLGMLVNNFMLDWTASSSAMYFSVSFWWIYCYN